MGIDVPLCTFGIITRDICGCICSCHLCGQWVRLTLTQKKTSCGWLSDIPGLLLCSSCFQTLFCLKIMLVLKLMKGSADSLMEDNLCIPKGTIIQTWGKSPLGFLPLLLQEHANSTQGKCNPDHPPHSSTLLKMLLLVVAFGRCAGNLRCGHWGY